ncbi:hypothetical protein [Pectinatus frisingensis]|uniref:gp53-like domain-containing protein n=1 Tax=Pectinatus frisingensis TaxID=865 RepID=UPI0018C66BDE|nr:hypothetical protein [Pectinatus frisingensis]
MAQYPGITLTNAGINMIAESQASKTALIFTNLKMGDGNLGDGEDIKKLLALKNPLLTLAPNLFKNKGNGLVTLRFAVSNENLETGFFAREIGVYAKIGDDGTEQLYAYTNAGNLTDYMPDKNTPIDEQIIDIDIITGNASEVKIYLDGKIMYITKPDFDEHINDKLAHKAAFGEHNNDSSAHKDIRQLINDTIKNIDLSPYAKLLSPEFSGIPTAPTADMGVNTNQIATMAAIVSALKDYTKTTELPNVSGLGIVTQSLAASGYIKFANGFIMQWFQYGNTGNTTTSWPITFPAACVGAIADGNSRETRCYAFNQSNVSYSGDGTYGRVLGWGF